jgi:hypothetical protein
MRPLLLLAPRLDAAQHLAKDRPTAARRIVPSGRAEPKRPGEKLCVRLHFLAERPRFVMLSEAKHLDDGWNPRWLASSTQILRWRSG